MSEFDWMLQTDRTPETTRNIEVPQVHKRTPRRRNLEHLKREEVETFLTTLPTPGESWHIVSNGKFDYWTFCPVVTKLLGRPVEEYYGSTWTMNRNNVTELFDLFDTGKIRRIAMLTGTYFKRRESAVANSLISGLMDRRQRYRAFQNHAKIMLLAAPPDYLVLEGSANFTANPRLEQNCLSNDEALYNFHRRWMEEILESNEPDAFYAGGPPR